MDSLSVLTAPVSSMRRRLFDLKFKSTLNFELTLEKLGNWARYPRLICSEFEADLKLGLKLSDLSMRIPQKFCRFFLPAKSLKAAAD